MIDNTFEHGTKREAIMPTESRGEPNDRDCAGNGLGRGCWKNFWAGDGGIEIRQNASISGDKVRHRGQRTRWTHSRRRSGMMGFVHYDCLEILWAELCQSKRLEECLISRDGPSQRQSMCPQRMRCQLRWR